MGSLFTYGILATSDTQAEQLLDLACSETSRIEKLLSEFLPESDTSRINRYASNDPVTVTRETFELITRCLAISRLTNGDFDITAGILKKLYPFGSRKKYPLPDELQIKQSLEKTGYQHLILDPEKLSVRFAVPGMHISFAAIGKGYASDRVRRLWQERGVRSGFVNASGDLNAFGHRAGGEHWKMGISNPTNPERILCYVDLEHTAAATSGDYEQYFNLGGHQFSHTINPRTGFPVTSSMSVTVISPGAELSDALATAVSVRGPQKGLALINQLPGTHCILFDRREGMQMSENMNYETITA